MFRRAEAGASCRALILPATLNPVVVLDTNVMSELMKPAEKRSKAVEEWALALAPEHVFTTSITLAEILAGIGLMPEGAAKNEKTDAAKRVFADVFGGRILPFDEDAARQYAPILISRRRLGRHIAGLDLQIAAIARSRNMTVATRNLRDFEDCGVDLIDPWTGQTA